VLPIHYNAGALMPVPGEASVLINYVMV